MRAEAFFFFFFLTFFFPGGGDIIMNIIPVGLTLNPITIDLRTSVSTSSPQLS